MLGFARLDYYIGLVVSQWRPRFRWVSANFSGPPLNIKAFSGAFCPFRSDSVGCVTLRSFLIVQTRFFFSLGEVRLVFLG